MYKEFYGFTCEPFSKDIDISTAFKSYHFNQAYSRLEYLKSIKGFGLVTGEPGVGKSFLLRYFISNLNPNLYKTIYIPISTLTVNEFYIALCNGLGLFPAFKKVNNFIQIQEAIVNLSQSKNITPVIIIDEAQFLKNSLLDDLRIIFNFDVDSKDRAIVILSAQSQFILQLNRQTHEALKQRIVINYHLKGLSKNDSDEYIKQRLKIAGRADPIFTDDALELLYSSSNGLIRPLSNLARMSLIYGANLKKHSIDSKDVYAAIQDVAISS